MSACESLLTDVSYVVMFCHVVAYYVFKESLTIDTEVIQKSASDRCY